MSELANITKGHATITHDGAVVGYVEYAETPRSEGGTVAYDRHWFAVDIHGSTYGHQADRASRAIARGATRGEAVAAFLRAVA